MLPDKLIEQEKLQILKEFLKSAPFERWSLTNLRKSSQTCGFTADYALLLFPEGISDFTCYFNTLMNQYMTEKFVGYNSSKISDKIAHLIELKLELYSPHKEAIRNLLQYNLMPPNICRAQKQLWQTCDQIWYLAGDTSTDYNYYTKRILLATIYSRSLLYWLSDESENYINTKDFIRRNIQDVGKLGKWKTSAMNFFKQLTM